MVMRFLLFMMLIIGCAGGPVAAADGTFQLCVERLKARAINQGVDADVVAQALTGLAADESVLAFLDAQPEFTTSPWDYLAGLVDDERIKDGRERLSHYHAVLHQAQEMFGVDPAIVVAVWGVESDYGRSMGKRSLVQSLTTLACGPRRQDYFASELMEMLRIMQKGEIVPPDYSGSWAGAFGQTQFMPSVYLSTAVDMDGDGRRDLVHSAADALGSTANYLHLHGWTKGMIWGREVKLPDGYNGPEGRRAKAPLRQWMARGIRAIDARSLEHSGLAGLSLALILPAGAQGPAFLVTPNFDAIFSYNASISYALAIAHLADRLRGGKAFVTPWPTDDPGLSRAERRRLQDILTKKGYDIGSSDGVIGTKTRQAIAQEQQRLGLVADGHPGVLILRALEAHH
jgi:lytic murein transglycosylase